MIAVGVFMTTCYNFIYNETNDTNYDYADTNYLRYGNGSILAITALICNFFAFILAVMKVIAGGSTIQAYENKFYSDRTTK